MSTSPNTIVTRASQSDVAAIIDFDSAITNVRPYIIAANELVTEICQNAPTKLQDGSNSIPYTSDRLKLIETWLAAHFLAIRDPRYASESIGAASASYQQQVGLNLRLTSYGQQAMLLDTKGGLAWLDQHIASGKRARASVTWVGNRCADRFYGYPWRFFSLYN